jgi:ankyrin repeat protein
VANKLRNLPLHILLNNPSSSATIVKQIIDKYKAASKYVNCEAELPLHIECRKLCRSDVISECVKLYPDALAKADNNGDLPLHLLLQNHDSSIDDAIKMLKKYPAALKHQNSFGYFPLRIECMQQCRSAVILKCIELYPDVLAIADPMHKLLLHLLMENRSSTVEEKMLLTIMESYPAALRHQSSDGNLPLHIECHRKCRSSILSRCINLYPESLEVVNKEGDLPLHAILQNILSSVDLAQMMIKNYPAALQHRNISGWLPLHLELKNQCRSAVLSQCMQPYPASVATDPMQKLPLHALLENRSSSINDKVLLLMIEKYPAALQHLLDSNYLPLHYICKNKCRSAVISKCIELYPEALAIADHSNQLPLHLVLDGGLSSTDTVLTMIEKYPAALQHQSKDGELPLIIECKNQCRFDVISKCIELCPETLAVADDSKQFPLHIVLKNAATSADLVLMLIEKYPAALQHRDNIGNLSLHIECKYLCRSSVVSKCIELYPEAVSITDDSKDSPLHVILKRSELSIEVVMMMIDNYPAALERPNNDGYLPLHIECKNRCRLSIISKCIELYPDALATHSMTYVLPLHLLLRNPSSSIDAALLMIEKYPTALQHKEYDRIGLANYYDDYDFDHDYYDQVYLPLHLECMNQCRPSILLKSIELYPEAVKASTGVKGDLPLHMILENELSPTDVALLMIEMYPKALRIRGTHNNIPIDIECMNQCRASVISKFIELDPEFLNDYTTAMIVRKMNKSNFRRYVSSLAVVFTARPMSLYAPAYACKDARNDPAIRRRILHLLPHHVITPIHDADYRDLNWQPRVAMMMLLSQIRQRSGHQGSQTAAILLDKLLRVGSGGPAQSSIGDDHGERLPRVSNGIKTSSYCQLLRIIKTSSLLTSLDVDEEGRAMKNDTRYSICQHEDLGDILLRSIFGFL